MNNKNEISIQDLMEQAALNKQDRWTVPAELAKRLIEEGKTVVAYYSPTSPAIVVEVLS